ncbi:MAG: hypothetical protein EOP86_05670 [Verrucomicrobiaceae bacterium]|nr:MAG: hypothetical protein EOP86_05670 [Verrucomicrobiaceae bacterium]
MDTLVAEFLHFVRCHDPCHAIIGNTISTGRISLTVLPSVSAPVAERLMLSFPLEATDKEAGLCGALKSCLVGQGNVPALRVRSRRVLQLSSRYCETAGEWRLQYSVHGDRKTLRAERLGRRAESGD